MTCQSAKGKDTLEMLTKIDNYLLPTSHTGRSDELDLVAINSTLHIAIKRD